MPTEYMFQNRSEGYPELFGLALSVFFTDACALLVQVS